MLKTFFFIPSDKEKFVRNVSSIDADCFVFDLEDAVAKNEAKACLERLNRLELHDNYYVRPRIEFNDGNIPNLKILNELIDIGFRKFLIPKVSKLDELKYVQKVLMLDENYEFENNQFILLVENPLCLMNLKEIVTSKIINITGITLGSHDYTNVVGMKHTLHYLSFARNYVLNVAKAYDLIAIDIASMNISDEEGFSNECMDAFNMGYDAKFVLHPQQLEVLKKTEYFYQEEVKNALEIYEEIKTMDLDKFSVIRVNGKLYEKPHLKRIMKIVEWNKNNTSILDNN